MPLEKHTLAPEKMPFHTAGITIIMRGAAFVFHYIFISLLYIARNDTLTLLVNISPTLYRMNNIYYIHYRVEIPVHTLLFVSSYTATRVLGGGGRYSKECNVTSLSSTYATKRHTSRHAYNVPRAGAARRRAAFSAAAKLHTHTLAPTAADGVAA